MRYLAIDLGDKRTGIAIGDSLTGIVTPTTVLEVPMHTRDGAELLETIIQTILDVAGPSAQLELVVGLPINMDGTEGQRARKVRDFAGRLGQRTGRALHFQDERLTTADADWSMARSGMTHKQKKERRDALAAAAILRDFLDARRDRGEPRGPPLD